MYQRRPSRHRIQTPMNEYAEFRVGIPFGQRMLMERVQRRLVVGRRLGLKIGKHRQARNKYNCGLAARTNQGKIHSLSPDFSVTSTARPQGNGNSRVPVGGFTCKVFTAIVLTFGSTA